MEIRTVRKLFRTMAFLGTLVFALSVFTSIVGWSVLIEVRESPTGGHLVSWETIPTGYFIYVQYFGVLDPEAHRLELSPPPIGADWAYRPAYPPDYPPELRIYVSHWFAGAPFGICGIWSWRKYRRLRVLASDNKCPICHYDLRAHKPGQKCPECGTEIPKFGWRKAN